MDANGQRFWMLADTGDWSFDTSTPTLEFDTAQRRLRLRSQRALPDVQAPPNERNLALQRLALVPDCLDAYGASAVWDSAAHAVVARGPFRDEVTIWSTGPQVILSDETMGFDGVLYLADGSSVLMFDRRQRWGPTSVSTNGFAPWRLTADPSGGVWALDRQHRAVARLVGYPFRDRPFSPDGAEEFRACQPNPDPPQMTVVTDADWIPADEDPVAIACSSTGRVTVITWTADGSARLRFVHSNTSHKLTDSRFPYSLAWIDDTRVAVRQSNLAREAPVYDTTSGADYSPVGEIYPVRDSDAGPFAHTLSFTPRYRTNAGDYVALLPLSLPSFATEGMATNALRIDSGNTRTTWHRVYLEACIPTGCGIRLQLAATNQAQAPQSDDEWHDHLFGDRFSQRPPEQDPRTAPARGGWVPSASELPFDGALLGCAPVRDRVGLFTVLIQRPRRATRALRGRYLWVRLTLLGNRLATPEVAALRAYASRFSYLERYLPELYKETTFGPDADRILVPGEPATAADFLDRFLATFEGVLTPLEDTIAAAYLVTDPASAPVDGLEWLASWIGLAFEPGYPISQRRSLLEAAPSLYRKHGTLTGLTLALDIATDGACTRGSIVVVEDFRLRRTAATILGANLADADDPLLAGLSVSGNSYVGDTLVLGDEYRDEFLAVFGPEVAQTPRERAAVAAFFDQLAYRVTVLVHRDTPSEELALIRRIVQLEAPAHVEVRILTASDAFLVGVASLIAIDTAPGPTPTPTGVQVDRSYLGWRDLVLGAPSLDPRLEAGGSTLPVTGFQRPEASALGAVAPFGAGFTVDASASHAATGHTISDYTWNMMGPT